MELNEEDALEAFWIFKTTNTSSDFQYATKGLWSLTAHQGVSGMSDYLLPYSVQQVEAGPNDYFYPLENNLEQALVEPDWEGFFKISIPLWNPIYEHYLLYGTEDEANSQRFDVYNEDVFE